MDVSQRHPSLFILPKSGVIGNSVYHDVRMGLAGFELPSTCSLVASFLTMHLPEHSFLGHQPGAQNWIL